MSKLLDQEIAELSRKDTGHAHKLILHNDNVNTMEHVMNCLVMICGHNVMQAEQCTLIAHHKGTCIVKEGHYIKLEEMMIHLRENNLKSEIQ
jgi:ATP-dependent Clp protease adaptor protein ClpS